MKLLVTVKEVAEVDDEFTIDGLDVDESYLEYDLNEWDDYAIEEAVQLSEANESSVRRELEGGVEELTDVTGPAVLSIQTGINEPRYASLRGIRQAQRKPLDVRTLDDLGLDESAVESPVKLTSMYEPESESDAIVWEGSADETAGELAGFLRDSGVVEG